MLWSGSREAVTKTGCADQTGLQAVSNSSCNKGSGKSLRSTESSLSHRMSQNGLQHDLTPRECHDSDQCVATESAAE